MSTQYSIETNTQPTERKKAVPTIYVVLGVTAVLLISGLAIWGIIALARTQGPVLESLRDIFIIALALQSCLFGIILLLMLVMIVRLVNMLEFEIKPILEKTNETVGMVRGTTSFMSENVVKPVTTITSYAAGVRRGLSALFGDPRKNLSD